VQPLEARKQAASSHWAVAAHACGAGDRLRLPGVAGAGPLGLARWGSRRPAAAGHIEAVVDRPH